MIAVVFMSFMSVVFLFPTSPQTSVKDMNYTVVVFGGVMILSLVWYYFPKYGGVHWFEGPIANIDIPMVDSADDGSSSEGLQDKKNAMAVSTVDAS